MTDTAKKTSTATKEPGSKKVTKQKSRRLSVQGLASIFTNNKPGKEEPDENSAMTENEETSDSSSIETTNLKWPTGLKGEKRRSKLYKTASWMVNSDAGEKSQTEEEKRKPDLPCGQPGETDPHNKCQTVSKENPAKSNPKSSSTPKLDLSKGLAALSEQDKKKKKKKKKRHVSSSLVPILSAREPCEEMSMPKDLVSDPALLRVPKKKCRVPVSSIQANCPEETEMQRNKRIALIAATRKSLLASFPEHINRWRELHSLAARSNVLPYLIRCIFVGTPGCKKSRLCSEYFEGVLGTPRISGKIYQKIVEVYGREFSFMVDDITEHTTHEQFEQIYAPTWKTIDVLMIGVDASISSEAPFCLGAIPRALEEAVKDGTPVMVVAIDGIGKMQQETLTAVEDGQPLTTAAKTFFEKFLSSQYGNRARNVRFDTIQTSLGKKKKVTAVFSVVFSMFVRNYVLQHGCLCDECLLFCGPCILEGNVESFVVGAARQKILAEKKDAEALDLARSFVVDKEQGIESQSEIADEYTSGENSENIEDFCHFCDYLSKVYENFCGGASTALEGQQ